MAYKQKSSIGSLCNSKGPMNMGNVLANPGDTGVQKNSSPAEKSLVGNQKNLPAHLVKAISDAPGKMTGSPLHAKEDIGKPGYDKYGTELIATKQARLKAEKTGSATATSSSSDSLYGRGGRSRSKSTGSVNGGKSVKPPATTSAGPAPTIKPKKVVKEQPSKSTTKDNTPPAVTGSDAVKLAKIKANKKNNSAPPEALTGGDAVKIAKINQKKKASEPKEMSRKQIREAKQKDKASGMSRKEVRANKLKRKASSARAKTTSKETAAKGGKEAQRLSRKTIRLEKKVAKQEGRVKASKM